MINLLSNAIRFSQASEAKTIDIKVEVSRKPPPSEDTCLRAVDDPDDLIAIAPGEKISIYVYVSVHDSGPGLKPKDLEILVSIRVLDLDRLVGLNSGFHSSKGSKKAQ
jgi:signal transduction histidine kinase